ncbi:DNA-binding CsgD family transcriptional regulator [Albidovulum inexpectatum]|uniref:DNA-binding CsgD family transcriptional regulator n=1 Tax=Albidovulum inexpectatum TaxID=196587 RepID=A0A2S5JGC6_9RHOB|nr:helix-turn-helix transcriptional regulator [Albidovulum inexpectatum]PPB80480.1 DNA-binding CsgD family transcriptional regulator [Albidovulum inexpectatum]
MRGVATILAVFLVQFICALFFVGDIVASVLGLPIGPMPWEYRELLEVGAAFGLLIGLILGGVLLRRALADRRRAEERLRRASSAFGELLMERFDEWGLTAAERDVALFAIKGLSTAEIAAIRGTSEGTIKAQTNAIYRKAGVSGRPQLISLFLEDLVHDLKPDMETDPSRPAATPGAAD